MANTAPSIEFSRVDGVVTLVCASGWHFDDGRCCAAVIGDPSWLEGNDPHGSDINHAELLIQHYIVKGEAVLKSIRQCFALVLHDRTSEATFAATDRLGRYPLSFQLAAGGELHVNSHPSAAASIDTRLNPQGIYDYFFFHMVPSPTSLFPGVVKLQPAHRLVVSEGSASTKRYWLPDFRRSSSQVGAKKFEEAGRALRDNLKRAVKNCLREDRRTGTFLSGGLDSSTVTGMLSEVGETGHPAFAIGFEEDGYDEMAFARITAEHFGVELNEYYVTPEDVFEALPTIAASFPEPFGNSSALPAFFCARMARQQGITHLLAGDGGDELFAGNTRYAKQGVFEHYNRIPEALQKGLVEPLASLIPTAVPGLSKIRSYIEQARIQLPDRLQSYNYLNRIPHSEMFSASFLQQVDEHRPTCLQRECFDAPEVATTLDRMLFLDWQHTLADNDFRKVSEMCHANNVLVSYPMMDDDLVAFSCGIPDDWKLQRGNLRHFYKESLRGWLPETTLTKKKQGFGLPFGLWMESYGPLSDLANDCLDKLSARDIFKPAFIRHLQDLHRNEHAAYYGEFIWVMTVFELWLQSRERGL